MMENNPLEFLHEVIQFMHQKKHEFWETVCLIKEQMLRTNDPQFDTEIPADVSLMPYVVNYKNRRHIYAYNPGTTAYTLKDTAGEWTTTIGPQAWKNISFPNGTRLLATTGPAILKTVCTDELYTDGIPSSLVAAITGNVTVNTTTGFFPSNVSALVAFTQQPTTPTYTSPDIAVASFRELAILLDFISFTGGTAPTITFTVSVKDAFGNYYKVYATAALSAATQIVLGLGPGMGMGTITSPDVGVGLPFGSIIQVAYTTTGTPTSISADITVIGK